MPKIVDHEAHSQDLAQRAASYFSENGYAGSSMRGVATYLGLSKSALYHYFPTKEDLFLACTREVMGRIDTNLVDPKATEEENLTRLAEVLRQDFAAEMALIFDYLRGKPASEIAEDKAMQLALEAYRQVFASIVGPVQAEEVMAQLFGRLLLDYISGR
jgi:AcrR family transcriptional regulator